MRTSQVKQSQVNNSISDKPYFGKLLTRRANYAMLRTQFEKKPEEEEERRKEHNEERGCFLARIGANSDHGTRFCQGLHQVGTPKQSLDHATTLRKGHLEVKLVET